MVLFIEPKEELLSNIPVLVFRPDEKTFGWGAPEQFPKMMCVGGLCPVTPEEVKCRNLGLNKKQIVTVRLFFF